MIIFDTIPVPPSLSRYVASIWTVSASAGERAVERVYGTGEPSLTIHCGTPFLAGDRQPRYALCGQSRGWADVAVTGETDTLSVSFTPAGLRAFVGVPAAELTERVVDAALVDRRLRSAVARVSSAGPGSRRSALLLESLEELCRPPEDPGFVLAGRIVSALRTAPDRPAVAGVVEEVGIGERMLQRLFADYVGLSPKALSIVARIDRAVSLLGSSAPLTDVAHAVGFYDHPQFTRTFKRATGYTPREFRSLLCAR